LLAAIARPDQIDLGVNSRNIQADSIKPGFRTKIQGFAVIVTPGHIVRVLWPNDIDEAEFGLKSHKAERESRGEIARGELRGITIEIEKTEPSPSELSTLQLLARHPCREASPATTNKWPCRNISS